MAIRINNVLLGLISFVVSIVLFSFLLPLLRSLYDLVLPSMGGVETFLLELIPFVIMFLMVFGLMRVFSGGEL